MKLSKLSPHLTTTDFQYINKVLRKTTLWYSQRSIALKRAKKVIGVDFTKDKFRQQNYLGKARTLYQCAECGELFRSADVEVDHIHGVEMSDCDDWNEYLTRLFCSADNLQVLCNECHGTKTFLDSLGEDFI